MVSTVLSVSYTHLDVYKRQVVECLKKEAENTNRSCEWSSGAVRVTDKFKITKGVWNDNWRTKKARRDGL